MTTMSRTVSEIMTDEVVVLHEEDNLAEVAFDMERFRFRHLPVVDDRTLVGLLSQRDLFRFTVSQLERGPAAASKDAMYKANTFVRAIMTQQPQTVLPETPISVAARKMVEARFDCLPVVDAKNELVGIVTSHDLLKVVAAMD